MCSLMFNMQNLWVEFMSLVLTRWRQWWNKWKIQNKNGTLENILPWKLFNQYVEVCFVGPIHYNNLTFIDKNKIDLWEPGKNYILVNLNCILYRWTHIVLALITLSDVILVSGLNKQFGIPDKAFIIGASALGDSINQFKWVLSILLIDWFS